ncbi:Leucine-rich repeat receptor-like protein kinase, partial [Quillaja saponaria]
SNQVPPSKMLFLRWVLNLFLILSLLSMSSENIAPATALAPVCSEADRASLLSFKARIFQDTTNILSSWTGTDCCDGGWEGIQCNPTTGRVTGLQLQRNDQDSGIYMMGTLSPSLGNLQFLEVMVISGMKHITGTIPESFSNLAHLTQLVLEDNFLEGNIPSGFSHLSQLQVLTLGGNHLRGQIPPALGSFKNLRHILLSRNFLTGPFPLTFRSLENLQYLDLSNNLLSGPIPDFVGQFKNLTFLDLSNNQFTGEIPASLFSLVNLLDLSLSHNKLTGNIPDQIGSLISLTTLQFSANKLTGHVPLSISRLQNLWYLNLSRNGFSDPLPDTLDQGIHSLLSVDLSYNNLNLGTVPNWIRSKQLSDVHLAGCKLKGTLPTFEKPDSLSSIDLSDNYFTDAGLSSIDLNSNQLVGSLSRIINNRTSSFLEVFDVSRNQISGGIPELNRGMNLKVLNIAGNKISGHIPDSISILIELERLDISRNHITGTIPSNLGQLSKLQWLDLSMNGLTGGIPNSLLQIAGLRHASFRVNMLCGEIPQGRPINIFPPATYAHNRCLCGKPLPPCRSKK